MMRSLICICCGAAISEEAKASGRNPNLCLACSNWPEELEESDFGDIYQCCDSACILKTVYSLENSQRAVSTDVK